MVAAAASPYPAAMSALPIWLFWEGEAPAYIRVCLEIVRRYHPDAQILDRAGFDRLWQHDRDLDIDRLSLNHQSDFARAYLLAHHGGLYVDADCVLFRSLAPVLELARRHGFVGYREPFGFMSCNFIAAEPGSAVARVHYNRVVARLRRPEPLLWLDLASVQMEVAMANAGETAAILPTHEIMPIPFAAVGELLARRSDVEHRTHFATDCRCYMLANHTLNTHPETYRLIGLPRADLLADDSFLAFLFRSGLAAAPRSDRLTSGGFTLASTPNARITIQSRPRR